jgi:hypothetical protein
MGKIVVVGLFVTTTPASPVRVCLTTFTACFVILVWAWTGMLLVFAYTCNLRANLLFRPSETPIDTYQVMEQEVFQICH